jgi:hypothetical protein
LAAFAAVVPEDLYREVHEHWLVRYTPELFPPE